MPLSEWESFYVIVGSSAGALIGLQFVVITLIADMPIVPGMQPATEAFLNPTVVHFGIVLLLSALMSAPWHALRGLALIWAIVGIAGVVYALVIARRAKRQTAYKPVFEDHLFHVILPLVAYAGIAAAALVARRHEYGALFTIAASTLLLLFSGIHNAWDAVVYNVFVQRKKYQDKQG